MYLTRCCTRQPTRPRSRRTGPSRPTKHHHRRLPSYPDANTLFASALEASIMNMAALKVRALRADRCVIQPFAKDFSSDEENRTFEPAALVRDRGHGAFR